MKCPIILGGIEIWDLILWETVCPVFSIVFFNRDTSNLYLRISIKSRFLPYIVRDV
jgi:hypothetical protein